MPASLRVLKNRNYRLYFAGQFISLTGTWMQSVAQSWLVYKLAQSGYWLGILTFCGHLPAFLISPLAGVVADQSDRRRILIIAESIAAVQAVALALLVFSGRAELWHVIALAVVNGLVGAFDMTTRHAFMVDLVGKADLSSAIAMNSMLINASRVLGPMIAGALIGFVGEGWCFLINGVSFIPVIVGLAIMTVPVRTRVRLPDSMLHNVREGIKYTRRNPVIFRLLLLSAFVSLIVWPIVVLLPVFAKVVLRGEAHTLAWLTGMMGVGAVSGAFMITASNETAVVRRKIILYVILCGISLVGFGLAKTFFLSAITIFGVGYFMMGLFPTITTALQHLVDDRMRGRVMSLYTMTFLGSTPFGGLFVGWASDRVGAPAVAIAGGAITVLTGASLAMRERLKAPRASRVEVAPGI